MSSRRAVVVSPEARRQLSDLLMHSEREWGASQQRQYARALGSAMLDLAENPLIGRARSDVADGLRSYRVRSHVIYYRFQDNRIFVAQVLHARCDPTLADWDASDASGNT